MLKLAFAAVHRVACHLRLKQGPASASSELVAKSGMPAEPKSPPRQGGATMFHFTADGGRSLQPGNCCRSGASAVPDA